MTVISTWYLMLFVPHLLAAPHWDIQPLKLGGIFAKCSNKVRLWEWSRHILTIIVAQIDTPGTRMSVTMPLLLFFLNILYDVCVISDTVDKRGKSPMMQHIIAIIFSVLEFTPLSISAVAIVKWWQWSLSIRDSQYFSLYVLVSSHIASNTNK